MSEPPKDEATGSWLQLDKDALEADLAFFEARLEILGEPATCYQKAQRKAYTALLESLSQMLKSLRRRRRLW